MKPLTIHSNGMGQQSVALYLLSSLGHIPRFDYSIFADPGSEKTKTYEYLDLLKSWAIKNNGIPLVHLQEKNLKEDLINSKESRFSSIPAFTSNPDGSKGILRRQCTDEYKIESVNHYVRSTIYGLNPKQWMPKGTRFVMGITLEEMRRINTPYQSRTINVYPFLNLETCKYTKPNVKYISSDIYQYCYRWMRSDCTSFIQSVGLPVPPKSACKFCPFLSDAEWKDMQENDPEDFKESVEVDKAIRNSTSKGVSNPIYLHKSCQPLDQVDFDKTQTSIEYEDCSGHCGI